MLLSAGVGLVGKVEIRLLVLLVGAAFATLLLGRLALELAAGGVRGQDSEVGAVAFLLVADVAVESGATILVEEGLHGLGPGDSV